MVFCTFIILPPLPHWTISIYATSPHCVYTTIYSGGNCPCSWREIDKRWRTWLWMLFIHYPTIRGRTSLLSDFVVIFSFLFPGYSRVLIPKTHTIKLKAFLTRKRPRNIFFYFNSSNLIMSVWTTYKPSFFQSLPLSLKLWFPFSPFLVSQYKFLVYCV